MEAGVRIWVEGVWGGVNEMEEAGRYEEASFYSLHRDNSRSMAMIARFFKHNNYFFYCYYRDFFYYYYYYYLSLSLLLLLLLLLLFLPSIIKYKWLGFYFFH